MTLSDLTKNCIDNILMCPCKICGSTKIEFIGTKDGRLIKETQGLYRCLDCGFVFIGNPNTDYTNLYNVEYYNGKGADSRVDYLFEFENMDRTIRIYEWEGIVKEVTSIGQSINQIIDKNTRWLDFGCGLGGLVKWVEKKIGCHVYGFEKNPVAQIHLNNGVHILNSEELAKYKGTFDIVTAIEVLEHVNDPLETLKLIHYLMKPGGIFFFTTGNAQKFRRDIINWYYISPEVHISFYEPKTMEIALTKTGFNPIWPDRRHGFNDIITYRILKRIGLRIRSVWQRFIPWNIIAWFVDKRYGMASFPVGVAI